MIIWRRMVVPKYGMYREFEIHTMITQDDYIPIATADELNALRNATAQTFGAGSKWEGAYTSGLDKQYVLIADIDLGVAPYNEGAGWPAIGTFTGSFDGAGRFISKLFASRSTRYYGLFGRVDEAAVIKNFAVVDANITNNNHDTGIATGMLFASAVAKNILSHGFVTQLTTFNYCGGVVGRQAISETKNDIINCSNFAVVSANVGRGGVTGYSHQTGEGEVQFCMGNGLVLGGDGLTAGNGIVISSYYNTDTSSSMSVTGTPKTTAELLALAPAEWDTSIWQFKADRYPIQRIFGEQAVHRAPPGQPTATIDGGNIVLDWDDAPSEVDLPDGYFVYQSVDNGAWTKLNATAVTDKTYTVESPAIGEHNYFVAAYYNDAAYKIKETGNSQTVTETIA